MGEMADDHEMYDEFIRQLFPRGRRLSAREDFTPTTEEHNMSIRETAQAQLERNELERQRLLTRLALLDKFEADDPWEDQTVISFDRNFGGPRTYSHVAIRLGGVWYVTGSRNANKSFLWQEFVEEHLAKAIPGTLFVADAWVAYDDVD